MNFSFKFVLSSVAILSLIAAAGLTYADTEQSRSFRYGIDTDFTYIDDLDGFNAQGQGPSIGDQVLRASARTLGLTKLRTELSWRYLQQSNFNVVLRPDALLDIFPADQPEDAERQRREFDSRSGTPYRQSPRIYLVDAYSLEVEMGQTFHLAVGVWERLAERVTAYKPVLEFGLVTRFLEKFAGANIHWASYKEEPDAAQEVAKSGYTFDFYVTQSREDRAETSRPTDDTYDEAPTSDPYHGVAVAVTRLDGGVNRFGLLAGISDGVDERTTTDENNTAVTTKDKRNEIYAQLYNRTHLSFSVLPTTLAAEVRYAKEKWKDSVFEARVQQSASLSLSTDLYQENWFLLGAHYGVSEPANDTEVTGYQIDVGYMKPIRSGVRFLLMATNEYRTISTSGQPDKSGFSNARGDSSLIRRFALQVDYQFQSY